jgi:hypothetical protein
LVYYSDFFVWGDAELAGAAFVVGLGVAAGSVTVGLGEAAGVDAGVLGALEFAAGSHAVANTDARSVGSSSARVIDLIAGLFIGYSSFEQD